MKREIKPFGNGVVRLRPITLDDLDLTMSWRNRDEVRVWFKDSQPLTPEQHRAWYTRYSARDDDFVFVIEADGQPVGHAAVYGIDWIERVAEIGRFMAAPEARGRGYIGLACGELLRFCGETLNLRSVFLEVKENNERAIGIYLRNGFREEARSAGMIRMCCRLDGTEVGSVFAAGA
jgi:diamine N-acetyltransferase